MSIQALYELQEETRRLAIAGSSLAIGDAKVKAIIPILKKLGERAPVFKRLSELAETLVTDESNSAENLLELSGLLASVLYTMGTTGKEGELAQGEGGIELPTDLSWLELQPLMHALETKGYGRTEIIQEAVKSGKFRDLRLVLPFINGLEDSYPEIGIFIAENVLPRFGKEALPFIEESFSMKGKAGDGKKLKAIHGILGNEGLPFYLECLENGSPQIKEAALELLANYDEAEEAILEQTTAKRAETRRAAYSALAARGTAAALKRLSEAVESKDQEMILQIARANPSPGIADALLGFAEKTLKAYLDGSKREMADLLSSAIWSLDGGKSKGVIEFLKKVAAEPRVSTELSKDAARILLQKQVYEIREFIEFLCHLPKKEHFADLSFLASLSIRTPDDVYSRYAKFVKKSRKDPAGGAILETIDKLISFEPTLQEFDQEYRWQAYRNTEDSEDEKIAWIDRWLPLFIDLDEENLVFRFARKIHGKEHLKYVLDKLALNPYFSSKRGMMAMVSLIQAGYENTFEVLVDTLKKTDQNMKSVQFHFRGIRDNLGLFACLPASYSTELERIAESKIEHELLKERLSEIAKEMRNREEL
ncbi:hypothetical protein DRW41_01725 [Neobacillus piezotolerans]|uniref:HEAT repeat domain-containing protein n=1 Tax=Neobacillus piezotolerans TaxID=2259171 RepID=A0A3D8GVC3_9BACI|nr:HEAT repeat domain-containing protein [Neobacillus piezotolerans]RDU38312.1 hypothetical protein DRW41_01725 [Neobacillus piezotolerans]